MCSFGIEIVYGYIKGNRRAERHVVRQYVLPLPCGVGDAPHSYFTFKIQSAVLLRTTLSINISTFYVDY